MNKEFLEQVLSEHLICETCPSPKEVADFFIEVLGTLYIDFAHTPLKSLQAIEDQFEILKAKLHNLLSRNPMNAILGTERICKEFFDAIPGIYDLLNKDIMAIYEGDPACNSRREVIRSYPGFYAIAAYRIAHILYTLKVEDLPRIITEHAHSLTGVDIHPGAQIGHSFCIDHGTGIVIGETAHIHNHVKIYQGVTLGALSVQKSDADVKRHPTIEEHCVLYAGSTILGGETIIGHHSTIGGNVWITKSLPPHSKVYYLPKMQADAQDDKDIMVLKEYAE